MLAKGVITSAIKVDLLTIAIGPEHHDLRLVDLKNPSNSIGRISFNIASHHKEKISINVKNVMCKVFHLVTNEVALKLKFKVKYLFKNL